MVLKKIFYYTVNYIKHKRVHFIYNKKIDDLVKRNNISSLSKNFQKEIRDNFAKFGFASVSLKWHQYYCNIYRRELCDFIPESIFYTSIEASLNNTIMYPALEDKNLLDKFYPSSFLPETIVKNINCFYYIDDSQVSLESVLEKCLTVDEFVIKPSVGTAGGTGVKKVELNSLSNKNDFLKKLFFDYKSDFVIQKILKQHKDLSNLNSSSINTIRVTSYMRVNEVVILSTVIRIGRSGSFTDNMSLGGIGCGLNKQGKLKEYGYDAFGDKFTKSDNGTVLKGYKIPMYNKIVECIQEKHKKMPYFKLISWDIMVTENNDIKMIEYNTLGQDINMHQMANGPLFGEYFSEILEIAKKHNTMDNLMKYGK